MSAQESYAVSCPNCQHFVSAIGPRISETPVRVRAGYAGISLSLKVDVVVTRCDSCGTHIPVKFEYQTNRSSFF